MGSSYKGTLAARTLLDSYAVALTERAIGHIADGSGYDLFKIFLGRIFPVRKDAPVAFDLPPITTISDVADAQIAIMQAVADGALTPQEGQTISAMTDRILKTLKEQSAESSSCDC